MIQPFIANFNANGDGEPLLYYQAQLGGGRGISGGGGVPFFPFGTLGQRPTRNVFI